jgi:ATP adenylyltransferase
MDNLFAPWRAQYILSNSDKQRDETSCFLCDYPKSDEDEKHRILCRGKFCFVIMNAYPYNPGHLMIVPYRHTADMPGLTEGETSELMALCQTAHRVVSEVMKPHGFNMGMNMGRVAGAGVDSHLHMHLVPRWNGDTNFMPALGETRIISEALSFTWKRLKEAWPEN